MKILLLFIFIVTNLLSEVNIFTSPKKVKNGTTFSVVLHSDTKLTQAPYINYNKKSYQMYTVKGSTKKYEVFLPVDYYEKPKNKSIKVIYKYNNKTIRKNLIINIIDGNYKKNEIIKVKKSKVTLSAKNKKKSSTEYSKVFKNVYSKITTNNYINTSEFINPINSKITSDFGTARIYNGIAKSYHTGVDFRAKTNTKIFSSNNGKVALVMKRFYLGNVVYISHGRGAYSYYAHMNNITVEEGQLVKAGDMLGYSGKSGRTTGPHLHYAFRLYNVTVDPLQFSKLHNEVIKNH